jgi:hypothetical protein
MLTALHYNIPISEISSKFNWNDEKTNRNISLLINNRLLNKRNDKYFPALGIFSYERGNLLKKKSVVIAKEIVDSIKGKLSEVKRIHSEMRISKTHKFYDLSFFYLSNVLLDNGQINNVERNFLNKERPLRNGERYYLAIFEKEKDEIIEPYGIYGNQGLIRNDSVYIAVYGNKRTKLNIGWENYMNKTVYNFTKGDSEKLFNEMPNSFFPTLINILEKNRLYFETTYKKLEFDKEISFEEFFIWWYHFIYTEATDILIEQVLIKKPEKGLFYY